MADCVEQIIVEVDCGFLCTQQETYYQINSSLDLSTCAEVLAQADEVRVSLLNITPAEGAQIAGAIALAWAVGWSFRAIKIQLIKDY